MKEENKTIKVLYLISNIFAIGIAFISITQLVVGGNKVFIAPLTGVVAYVFLKELWRK